jgi:hypothetical protein
MKDKKSWKEIILLLPVEGQPTKIILAKTCVDVVFIRSVSDTIYSVLFLPKPPAERRGPRVVHGPQFLNSVMREVALIE